MKVHSNILTGAFDGLPPAVEPLVTRAEQRLGHDPAKINIGCGSDILTGWTNVDMLCLPGVDLLGSIDQGLGIPSASIDLALCRDVLEHVELEPAMEELWRILRPGGLCIISVPHFTSRNVWLDPTHKRGFSVDTFQFFTELSPFSHRPYRGRFEFAAMLYSGIEFRKGRLVWNRLMEPLVNRTDQSRRLFEMTGVSRLFPADNVIAVLER